LHRLPLEGTPKIIQDPETTASEILAHDRGIFVSEDHLFRFAGINEGIPEEVWIVDRHSAFIVRDIEVGQTLQPHDQLPIRFWIVGVPVLVISGNSPVVNQASENDLIRFTFWLVNVARIIVSAKQSQFLRENASGCDADQKNDRTDPYPFHQSSCAFTGGPR